LYILAIAKKGAILKINKIGTSISLTKDPISMILGLLLKTSQ
jgi:hypothetical protein